MKGGRLTLAAWEFLTHSRVVTSRTMQMQELGGLDLFIEQFHNGVVWPKLRFYVFPTIMKIIIIICFGIEM
jgi:hypothetical protein